MMADGPGSERRRTAPCTIWLRVSIARSDDALTGDGHVSSLSVAGGVHDRYGRGVRLRGLGDVSTPAATAVHGALGGCAQRTHRADPGPHPPTVHAGDRLLLAAQSRATRIALVLSELSSLPSSASYPLVIRHGSMPVRVTVPAVDGNRGALASWADWLTLYNVILFAVIALLALWRGHDRAAMGIALWGIAAAPLAFASALFFALRGNGMALFGGLGFWGFSLLGRLGFYVMAESIAGSALSPRRRILWRSLFALVLGAAAITVLV